MIQADYITLTLCAGAVACLSAIITVWALQRIRNNKKEDK